MNIKNYILIGLIVIAVIIAGYFIYQNNISSSPTTNIQPVQNAIPAQEVPQANTTKISCDDMEDEIKSMLNKVNYCNSVSDCLVEWTYYCPFGCYQFFNKNAD